MPLLRSLQRVGDVRLVARVRVPEPGTWYRTDLVEGDWPVFARVPHEGEGHEDPDALALAWDRLKVLEHAGLPKPVAYDATAGVLLVAAPEGVPLQRLVEHRVESGFVMTPATVLDVGVALADALTYAHERGKPHGHLSPASVWLGADGGLVVWGFGAGPDAAPPARWASPERARGRRASGDADQWALGALLAGLVTSRVPWRSDDPLTEARVGDASHLHGPVSDQWRPLGRVLEKMLQAETRDRYPSLHPVRQALSALRQRVPGSGELPALGARLTALYGGATLEPSGERPTTVSESEPPHAAVDPAVQPPAAMLHVPLDLEVAPEADTSPTRVPTDEDDLPSVFDEPLHPGEPTLGLPEPSVAAPAPAAEATLGLPPVLPDLPEVEPVDDADLLDVVPEALSAEPLDAYADVHAAEPADDAPSLPGAAVEPVDADDDEAWLRTDTHPSLPLPVVEPVAASAEVSSDLPPELEVEPAVIARAAEPEDDRAWFERVDVRPYAPYVVGALVVTFVVYVVWLTW